MPLPPIPPSIYDPFTNEAPSKYYKFMHPCQQNSGTYILRDASGAGGDGIFNLAGQSETAYWASAGYATVGAGQHNTFQVPLANSSTNIFTESFIYSIVLNGAAPASTITILGNGYPTNNGFYAPGWYIEVKTTGKAHIIFCENGQGNALSSLSDITPAVFDGTDHQLTFFYDGPTGCCFVYVDGVQKLSNINVMQQAASAVCTKNFVIGNDVYEAAVPASGFKFKGQHLLVFPGSLPINCPQLATLLKINPLIPLTDKQIKVV